MTIASASGRVSILALGLCLAVCLISLRRTISGERSGVANKTNVRMAFVIVMAASALMACINLQYAAVLPCLWLSVYLLARMEQVALYAQLALLFFAVVCGFNAHQKAIVSARVMQQIADIQRKTAALVATLPEHSNIALLNLPDRIADFPGFDDASQVQGMLSKPFCAHCSDHILWLDSFVKNDQIVNQELLKRISEKASRYKLLAWNEVSGNYEVLRIAPGIARLDDRALPVVSLGNFKRTDGDGMSMTFSNRQHGDEISSVLLPVANGVAPLDYDTLELTLERKNAHSESCNSSTCSANPVREERGDAEILTGVRALTPPSIEPNFASLSWSSQSLDSTECGAAMSLPLKDRQSIKFDLPLSCNKRWLTCKQIRAFRLDLPNESAEYSVASAVLRRKSERSSAGNLIVSSKSPDFH